METNDDNIDYNCVICNQDFKSASTLDNHKNTQKHFSNMKLFDITTKNDNIINKLDVINNKLDKQTEAILEKLCEFNENRLNKLLNELNKKEDQQTRAILGKLGQLNKKEESNSLISYFGVSIPIILSVGFFIFKQLNSKV